MAESTAYITFHLMASQATNKDMAHVAILQQLALQFLPPVSVYAMLCFYKLYFVFYYSLISLTITCHNFFWSMYILQHIQVKQQ